MIMNMIKMMIEKMNITYVSKKVKSTLLWGFNQITNKFTAPYRKLKQWFPIIEKYTALKYAMIPVVIASIAGLRVVMKQVVGALASFISSYSSNISDINISESTIISGIIGVLISIKIISQITKGRRVKSIQA